MNETVYIFHRDFPEYVERMEAIARAFWDAMWHDYSDWQLI